MKTMFYILPLPPVGVNHAYRSTHGGRMYKVKSLVDWENECLWKLKGKTQKLEKEELTMNVTFFDADNRRRDIDNRLKPVLDLFQKAGAYKDDSLIYNLIVCKRFDFNKPRVEVEIY